MDEIHEHTLTVINYVIPEEYEVIENHEIVRNRVTISPGMVLFVIAGDETFETVDGIELRKVNVVLAGGNNLELFISLLDLNLLERCVGMVLTP
jgi:hypothetical protein